MRVTNDVLDEIIENDGCRRGSVTPINSTGVVRLALDLQEARRQIADLQAAFNHATEGWRTVTKQAGEAGRIVPTKTTRLDRGKRTKKK
jgi:hypothetical protein